MKIWAAPAARIARPVTSARISSVRVFTRPSSRTRPSPNRGRHGRTAEPRLRIARPIAGTLTRLSGESASTPALLHPNLGVATREGPRRTTHRQGPGRRPRGHLRRRRRAHGHRGHHLHLPDRRQPGAARHRRTRRSTRSGASSSSPGPACSSRSSRRSAARWPTAAPRASAAVRSSTAPRASARCSPASMVVARARRRRCTSTALFHGDWLARRQPRDRPRRLRVHAPHARHALGQRPVPALRRDPGHRRCARSSSPRSCSMRSASRPPARTACASRSRRSSPPRSRCAASRGCSSPARRRPYSELSNSLGWLLAGSLLMQVLGYSVAARRQHAQGAERQQLVAGAQQRVLRRPRPTAAVPGRAGHPAPEARRPRRRRPPRRLPHRAQTADGASCVGIAALGTAAAFADRRARSARSCSRRSTSTALDLGLLVAGQRHVHHRPDDRPGPDRAPRPRAAAVAWGAGVVGFVDRSPRRSRIWSCGSSSGSSPAPASPRRHGVGAATSACATAFDRGHRLADRTDRARTARPLSRVPRSGAARPPVDHPGRGDRRGVRATCCGSARPAGAPPNAGEEAVVADGVAAAAGERPRDPSRDVATEVRRRRLSWARRRRATPRRSRRACTHPAAGVAHDVASDRPPGPVGTSRHRGAPPTGWIAPNASSTYQPLVKRTSLRATSQPGQVRPACRARARRRSDGSRRSRRGPSRHPASRSTRSRAISSPAKYGPGPGGA